MSEVKRSLSEENSVLIKKKDFTKAVQKAFGLWEEKSFAKRSPPKNLSPTIKMAMPSFAESKGSSPINLSALDIESSSSAWGVNKQEL